VSVVASDLVVYLSANVPDTDTGTAGGAIDTLRFPDFTQLASNAAIEVVSSNAGDTTQTVTVEARKADGTFVSQTVALNGTTAVQFGTISTIERVLTGELSATTTGNVTLRVTGAGATIRVIAAGSRGFKAIHRRISSDPVSTVTRYAKVFAKNTNGTFALLSALVKQSADPAGVITHALDATKDATTSVADRTTSPGFTFDDTDKAVPGTDLGAGVAIGVWLKISLAAGNAPIRNTYTLALSGSTT